MAEAEGDAGAALYSWPLLLLATLLWLPSLPRRYILAVAAVSKTFVTAVEAMALERRTTAVVVRRARSRRVEVGEGGIWTTSLSTGAESVQDTPGGGVDGLFKLASPETESLLDSAWPS